MTDAGNTTLAGADNLQAQRSMVICKHGCTGSSQPLASQIGLDVLKKGGNAADAAVAMAAALNVLQPCSTGIGGDAFCLFYDNNKKVVQAMNASGRSPANLTLDLLNTSGINTNTGYPLTHGLAVTVPGAAAGWVDCHEKFGSKKLTFKKLLNPAIELASEGFPIAGPWTSFWWEESSTPFFDPRNVYAKDLLVEDQSSGSLQFRAPKTGEVFKNLNLARVLETLADKGKSGFYEGWVAEAIVEAVKRFDGVMEKDDLKKHYSTFEDPIMIEYKGIKLWETAPNGQGIVALEALNILKNFNLEGIGHNSAQYLHLLIEALKLSFGDAMAHCSDPAHNEVPVKEILNAEYGKIRANMIHKEKATASISAGNPLNCHGDTVYFTVIDEKRNACSFINSNYTRFGTGIVPKGCGFSLHNRGANFSLVPGHPNIAAPNKRTYHTIIPAMVTDGATNDLVMSYGVMGKFMQPQGHVQVLLSQLEFGYNPQEALDLPRICVQFGNDPVLYEKGIPDDVIQSLREMGHNLHGPVCGFERNKFGNGQVICVQPFWDKEVNKRIPSRTKSEVLWAGSDSRCDGQAVGY